MTFEAYKDLLLDYLYRLKIYIEQDIRENAQLSDDEKEEQGLLIRGAHVLSRLGDEYELSAPYNNTKLRGGDRVLLRMEEQHGFISAEVIENNLDRISVSCTNELDGTVFYRIEIVELMLLDTLIKLIENIEDGTPGSAFLEILAGIEQPLKRGLCALRHGAIRLPQTMNPQQRDACLAVFNRPSIYCIQGPPGTGKTDVLANIALAFIREHKQVLILSKTHQAVNNALNKIAKMDAKAPVYKIGNALKAQDLADSVENIVRFSDYLNHTQKTAKKNAGPVANVLGMTLQGAYVNLGLRKSCVLPMVVLVDEAGQVPLVEAAAIGAFRCGSLIFIGDDRQMPPIYHENLQTDPLSISIFSSLTERFPDFKTALTVTYRMNREITECVSRQFYEPFGVNLTASEFSANRHLVLEAQAADHSINSILRSEESLIQLNVTSDTGCEDVNLEEAQYIAGLLKAATGAGMSVEDIAVITPYRRQVNTIHAFCNQIMSEVPLIDTVERIQGQDVDLIIVSMCASSQRFFNANKAFLLNPNRLNVMISRAKKKVVVLASDIIPNLFM